MSTPATMQQRRDTAANWASANPVLAQGEVGIDLTALAADTPAIKIGDGATAWGSLPFAASVASGGSSTPTASTLAEWDANENMSAGAFLPIETSTAASSTPIVMTIDSTQVQTITGATTAQTIELPTTSVKAGYTCIINNQTSGAIVTVQASNGSVVATLPVGALGIFRAWLDTPTNNTRWIGDVRLAGAVLTAYNDTIAITYDGTQTIWTLPSSSAPANSVLAQWDVQSNMSANNFLSLQTSTAASATPIALSLASTQVQIITGTTTAQTMTLPTTAIPAGFEQVIINQMTTATVTVEASGGTVVGLVAPGEIGVFRTAFASPTLNTQWTADTRLIGVAFKVNTAKLVIGTNGTDVAYTLPATASTLLASGGALGTPSSGVLTNLTGSPTLTAPALGTPASGNLANCTGLPGFQPSDYGWISWTSDPMIAYSSAIPSGGVANFSLLPIRVATTITNVILDVQTAGSTLTSGQCFAGLFNSSGTLLSATADQHTAWQSTGLKTMALSAAQSVAAGLYYVAMFWTGTTGPKFAVNAASSSLNGANSGPLASIPRAASDVVNTGLTTAFHSPATLSATAGAYWAAVS